MKTEAPKPLNPERDQTDESLRAEREKSDTVMAEQTEEADELADAVVVKARQLADEVVATARAKTDQQSAAQRVPPATLARERRKEDEVLVEERAEADEIVQEERAEHVALLAAERQETDRDLVHERHHSDAALATRDDFLGIVSHDLRTLLSQVMGFAGLITMELAGKQDLQRMAQHAERIQRSGVLMNRLIGDLVDVASIHAGTLTVSAHPDDPARVVTEVVDAFQAQAVAGGITLVATTVPPPMSVPLDPARIFQVLTNLLSNAIKFTPTRGHITARVECIGPDVQFSVSDTGTGIPADKLETIFERYLQVDAHDRRGVGLGLYIAKCIVLGHGGRIWAQSVVGKGSTFFFTVPLEVEKPG